MRSSRNVCVRLNLIRTSVLVPLIWVSVRAFSTQSTDPQPFIPQINHRRLNMNETRDEALYRRLCEWFRCDDACGPIASCIPHLEAAFAPEASRRLVLQLVAISDDPTILAAISEVPNEAKKLMKLLEKEKQKDEEKEPVKKFLLKEIPKLLGDSNPETTAAFLRAIEAMTEQQVRDLLEFLMNLSTESTLGLFDRARISLLRSVGAI